MPNTICPRCGSPYNGEDRYPVSLRCGRNFCLACSTAFTSGPIYVCPQDRRVSASAPLNFYLWETLHGRPYSQAARQHRRQHNRRINLACFLVSLVVLLPILLGVFYSTPGGWASWIPMRWRSPIPRHSVNTRPTSTSAVRNVMSEKVEKIPTTAVLKKVEEIYAEAIKARSAETTEAALKNVEESTIKARGTETAEKGVEAEVCETDIQGEDLGIISDLNTSAEDGKLRTKVFMTPVEDAEIRGPDLNVSDDDMKLSDDAAADPAEETRKRMCDMLASSSNDDQLDADSLYGLWSTFHTFSCLLYRPLDGAWSCDNLANRLDKHKGNPKVQLLGLQMLQGCADRQGSKMNDMKYLIALIRTLQESKEKRDVQYDGIRKLLELAVRNATVATYVAFGDDEETADNAYGIVRAALLRFPKDEELQSLGWLAYAGFYCNGMLVPGQGEVTGYPREARDFGHLVESLEKGGKCHLLSAVSKRLLIDNELLVVAIGNIENWKCSSENGMPVKDAFDMTATAMEAFQKDVDMQTRLVSRLADLLILKIGPRDLKRLRRGLEIIIRLPRKIRYDSKLFDNKICNELSQMLVYFQEDPNTMHLLLATLNKIALRCSGPIGDFGGWEVVVQALQQFPSHKDLQHESLSFFAWYGRAPESTDVIKTTIKVLARIVRESDKGQIFGILLDLRRLLEMKIFFTPKVQDIMRDEVLIDVLLECFKKQDKNNCYVVGTSLEIFAKLTTLDDEAITTRLKRGGACKYVQDLSLGLRGEKCSQIGEIIKNIKNIARDLSCG